MKKVFNSLFVIIAAMVTFAGCAKQEIDAPATPETKTVQFFANSIETKTVFGTPNDGVYPTLWSDGDQVRFFLNLDNVKNTDKAADVECLDENKSAARFEAQFDDPGSADPEYKYTFYAISPESAYVDGAKSANDGRITVTIPDNQTPRTSTVDPLAQILYAASETTDDMPSSVELKFHHLTAYGRFTLSNLANDDSPISMVKIEAPEDVYLSGKWNYFVNGDTTIGVKEGINIITINTTNTTDIWFACAPADVAGKTLKFTVTTEAGNNFVRNVTFPSSAKFESGKIAKFTVDMTGITAGGTDEPEQPGENEGTSVATLSSEEIKNNIAASKCAYGTAVSYEDMDDGVVWTSTCFTDQAARPWLQMKAHEDVYIKISSDSDIKEVEITVTGTSNEKGGILDINKHNSFSGTLSLNTQADGKGTNVSSGSAANNIVTLTPTGNYKTLYLKTSAGARVWNIDVKKSDGGNEGGGETPEPTEPYIRVSETAFDVPATQTSVEFTVESNVGWGIIEAGGVETSIIDVSEDGLTMTIQADFEANESSEPKTYTITFIPEELDETVTVTINQAAKVEVDDSFEPGAYWIVANEKYAMPLTGNYGYIQVDNAGYTDNVFTFTWVENGYTIQQADGKYLYMTESYDSFNVSATAPTDNSHIWTIAQNEDGSYKVVNTVKQKYIQLDSQHGTYGAYDTEKGTMPNLVPANEATVRPVFSVTSVSKNVACDVTKASFEIVSNQNWTVVPGEGVSVDNTSGSGNGTVTLTFAGNTSEVDVVYKATVKAEGFDDIVLTVVQAGVPTGDVTETVVDLTWELGSNAYDGTSSTKQTATINGVAYSNILKLGSSKAAGTATITLPAGTTKVTYSAVAWKGGNCTLKFTVAGTDFTQKIAANTGATGNPKYTISSASSDNYELLISVAEETTMTVTTTSSVRAIIWDLKAVVVE